MLGSVLALLFAQSSAFAPVGGVQVSCLENLRGKVGRARVEIVVGAGALDEGENERGVAHLLEHLLLRPINFDDSNATTSWDFTSFYRDVTGGELQEASIELLRAIRVAGFDDQSFDTEKKIVLNELRDRGVSMSAGVDPIFGDTLLARLPGGDDASVRALRTADAKSYHQRFYTKGNLAVVLRGAVECASLQKALTPELKKFAEGMASATAHVREPEPGPRALPHVPGEFLQGFYWYDASPEDEVVWRLIVRHLEHRALDELRKERAITYSPQGTFSRRGYGGQIDLTVKTQDGESDAAEWYQEELASIRTDPQPKTTMTGSIQRVRKALESDNARAGLAAIRNERQPIEILDKLDDADLQARLQRLLQERRSFGTATPESNVASLVVLGLFGVLVLVVLWVAARKLVS
jgi:predicted Zn-dependent peptidase